MALFGNIFGKNKENNTKKGIDGLLEALKQAQGKKDPVQTAKLYYQVGEAYLKQGNKEKAWLYIGRFDALAGSQDEIYEQIPETMMDQASEWIEMLEESDLYLNRLNQWAQEEGEELLGLQKVKWNLLTLARFVSLFDRLSGLRGFEVLANYRRVIDILGGAVYGSVTNEEYELLLDFIRAFYPFTDSEELSDVSNCISVEGGADFEGYDLVGFSVLLNMYEMLDDLIRLVEEGISTGDVSTEFVTSSLMAGYYIRTWDTPLEEIPAVLEEEKRIRADYETVKDPDQNVFMERMEAYKKLLLPAGK